MLCYTVLYYNIIYHTILLMQVVHFFSARLAQASITQEASVLDLSKWYHIKHIISSNDIPFTSSLKWDPIGKQHTHTHRHTRAHFSRLQKWNSLEQEAPFERDPPPTTGATRSRGLKRGGGYC